MEYQTQSLKEQDQEAQTAQPERVSIPLDTSTGVGLDGGAKAMALTLVSGKLSKNLEFTNFSMKFTLIWYRFFSR